MKKLLVTIITIALTSVSAFSQSENEEVDFYQSIFGMEKKAITEGFIQLDENKKADFWNIYDEYEAERKELGKKRIALISDYAENYAALTDEKMDELINSAIKQKANTDVLMAKYYKKIKKSVGSKSAAQFYQLENYFMSAIRAGIFESIPFIGELEKK